MKVKKVSSERKKDIDERVDGLALCLLHLEEETRQCGLDFTALLIKAAAISLSHTQQDKVMTPVRSYRKAL